MALPAAAILEVRSTGSDSNGGGFNSARGGTDYTLQDAAQATGTVTSSTTTVTATTGIFTSAMVGNYITDGTTWKEITAFTSSTVVTVDSAPSWTSVAIKVGGALATPAKAISIGVAGNTIFIKAGTYATTGLAITSGFSFVVVGYSTTRTINNTDTRPVIQATAGATTVLTVTGSVPGLIYNLVIDANSIASCKGISLSSTYVVRGCKIIGFTTDGVTGSGGRLEKCEITANGTGAVSGVQGGAGALYVFDCYIHDLTCRAAYSNSGTLWIFSSLIANCSGASSDGFLMQGNTVFVNNIVYNCGQDGLNFSASGTYQPMLAIVFGNIFAKNARYQINYTAGGTTAATINWDYNAVWNSGGTGNTNNVTLGANNVSLTADPFTNAASGDFSLNNTAGGGAACRSVGWPNSWPGLSTTTGYRDIGAVQAQASGFIGGGNLSGGLQ